MFVVADMLAGSLLENVVDSDMIGNLVDFGGNWVDETEQDIDVRMVALVAHDQTDSRKNLDGFAIPGCMFWSMDCSWVWCMLHSYFQGIFETGRQDTLQTGG